jgi:hypothetical protein
MRLVLLLTVMTMSTINPKAYAWKSEGYAPRGGDRCDQPERYEDTYCVRKRAENEQRSRQLENEYNRELDIRERKQNLQAQRYFSHRHWNISEIFAIQNGFALLFKYRNLVCEFNTEGGDCIPYQ